MDKKVAPRKIEMDKILVEASKLPYCKIDRDDFLRTQLRGKISEKQLNEALKYGTINAGIELAVLDKIADGVIKLETTKAVGKAIPVAGAVVNGTLTAVSFSTSAKKLKKALSTFAAMTPEKLEKASAVADVVLSDFESLTADDKVLPMKDEDVIVSEDDM